MNKNIYRQILVGLTFLALSITALAQTGNTINSGSPVNETKKVFTAKQYMDSIHFFHSQRFDSNRVFVVDKARDELFIQRQNNVIASLRKKGHIGRSFKITNSFKSDLTFTVSEVHEKNGDFVGIIIERTTYSNKEAEARLRVFNVAILTAGMPLYKVEDKVLAHIKADINSVSNGGTLTIKYPLDYKKNILNTYIINLAKNSIGGFDFKQPNGMSVNSIHLNISVSLTLNFGIKSITVK